MESYVMFTRILFTIILTIFYYNFDQIYLQQFYIMTATVGDLVCCFAAFLLVLLPPPL